MPLEAPLSQSDVDRLLAMVSDDIKLERSEAELSERDRQVLLARQLELIKAQAHGDVKNGVLSKEQVESKIAFYGRHVESLKRLISPVSQEKDKQRYQKDIEFYGAVYGIWLDARNVTVERVSPTQQGSPSTSSAPRRDRTTSMDERVLDIDRVYGGDAYRAELNRIRLLYQNVDVHAKVSAKRDLEHLLVALDLYDECKPLVSVSPTPAAAVAASPPPERPTVPVEPRVVASPASTTGSLAAASPPRRESITAISSVPSAAAATTRLTTTISGSGTPPSRRLSSGSIQIYAAPSNPTRQVVDAGEQYLRTAYQLSNPEHKKAFLSSEGLKVRAPSGVAYSFSYANDTPTARLDHQPDMDKKQLTFTVISMIDNVLAKSSVVNVDTHDPMVAAIALEYLNHLQTKGINLSSSIKLAGAIYKPDPAAVSASDSPDKKALKEFIQTDRVDPPAVTSDEGSWLSEVKQENRGGLFREKMNQMRSDLSSELDVPGDVELSRNRGPGSF